MPESQITNSEQRAAELRRMMTMARWLLYLAFVVIGYLILSRLAGVIAPLLVAAGIAYLLDPLVDRLEVKMSRAKAVALLLVGFLVVVGGAVALLVPLIVHEGSAFVLKLPQLVDNGVHWVGAKLNLEVPESWQDYLKGEEVKTALSGMIGPASALLSAALGGLFSLLGFLAELLLIPVFAFYFLLDWDNMVDRGRRMIPPRHREYVVDVIKDVDGVVNGWIRGQFTVTAILAILYAISFKVVHFSTSGMNLAITMGLIVGALTVVPFLGTIVGALLTAMVLMLDYHGPGPLIGCGAVFIVLHLLEAAVLTPKIVGHRVGLSEVGALFAVLAGGKLLGFTGVLLAVPIAAGVAVLVRRGYSYYEDSEFYGAEDEPAEAMEWPIGAEAIMLGHIGTEPEPEPDVEAEPVVETESAGTGTADGTDRDDGEDSEPDA